MQQLMNSHKNKLPSFLNKNGGYYQLPSAPPIHLPPTPRNSPHLDQAHFSSQFEAVSEYDIKELSLYRERRQERRKGAPKVMILSCSSGKTVVYVQKSSLLLFQYLKNLPLREKVSRIVEAFKTLCSLAADYGYFYVDKQMMKVSKKGETLCWFHQNFAHNHREFAIQPSEVSEIIFVKKLKMTFSEIIPFSTAIDIESISQMSVYLHSLITIDHKQNLTSTQTLDKLPPKATRNRIFSAFNSPPKFHIPTSPELKMELKDFHSPQRPKRILDSSKDWMRHLSPRYQFRSPEVRPQNGQDTSSIKSADKVKIAWKARKQSADISSLSKWLKSSSKGIDKSYANSTFSTRVTFSSQANSVSHCELDDKEKSGPPTSESTKSPQNKKMLEEAPMRIVEESLELEMQNLFDSVRTNQKSNKESVIMQELERLFESSMEGDRLRQSVLMGEIEDVLCD